MNEQEPAPVVRKIRENPPESRNGSVHAPELIGRETGRIGLESEHDEIEHCLDESRRCFRIGIEGESFRLKEAKERTEQRKKQRAARKANPRRRKASDT